MTGLLARSSRNMGLIRSEDEIKNNKVSVVLLEVFAREIMKKVYKRCQDYKKT